MTPQMGHLVLCLRQPFLVGSFTLPRGYKDLGDGDEGSPRRMGRRAGGLRLPLPEAGSKNPTPRISLEQREGGKGPVIPSDTFTSGSRVWLPEPESHTFRNIRGTGWVGATCPLGSTVCRPTDLQAPGALPSAFGRANLMWPCRPSKGILLMPQ